MEINFIKETSNYQQHILIVTTDILDFPASIANIEKISEVAIKNLIKTQKFEGKKFQSISIPTSSSKIKSISIVSLGKLDELDTPDAMGVGKVIYSLLSTKDSEKGTVYFSDSAMPNKKNSHTLYEILMGASIANYKFDKYFSKKQEEDAHKHKLQSIDIIHTSPNTSKLEFEQYTSVLSGMKLAKDLVSEPANVLNPIEFASRCKDLKKYGLKVEILEPKEMKALGMNTLLGVAQGSSNEARMVIMRWEGGKKGEKPLAFVGKGVTFDTGGLSLKPANAMIGMKYDKGGASVVTGLMTTLALRKAKVNAVGVIGIVENMPDGNAQRPEDVVKSMSGQTVEILNTDAEGRLVLADALWYTQSVYKPELMINLATLTGAIVMTFADQYAGLFSNDDTLSKNLYEAGIKTGEKLWRLPLTKEYDKMIDSKVADMQNIGSAKGAGSITAAQFLQRFVNNVPWAHLDIAGVTNIDKPTNISQAGATAFGVRLLNQFIQDNYES